MKGPQRLWVLFILFGFLLTPLSTGHVEALSLKDRFENALMDIGRKQAAAEVRTPSVVSQRTIALRAPRAQASVSRSGFLEWLGELVSGTFSRIASFFSSTKKQVAIISDSAAGSVSTRASTTSVSTSTAVVATSTAESSSGAAPKPVTSAPVSVQKTVQSGVTVSAFEALRAEVAALKSAGLAAETPLAREPVGQARYTNTEIDSRFSQLSNLISSSAFDVQSANRTISANSAAIALTNKIDQLKGITIINPEIQGTITMVAAGDAPSSLSLAGNASVGGTLTVVGNSTFQNFTAQNSTTTNATTTSLYISGSADIDTDLTVESTTSVKFLYVREGAGGITVDGGGGILIRSLAGFVNNSSSTLQDFTGTNATTTNATTTTLHVSSNLTTLGRLAVGTTSPAANLHIYGSDPGILLEDTVSNVSIFNADNEFGIASVGANRTDLLINQSTGNVGFGTTTTFAALAVEQGSGKIGFAVGSSTATNFIIDSAGRVGVGTTSPFRRFTVGGDAAFTGDLFLPNLIATGTVQASSTALFGGGLIAYASSTLQAITATTGRFLDVFQASSTALFGSGFLSYSSSTLQNFTGVNATTTNATTTNLTASNQVYFTNLPTAGASTDINITADGQLYEVSSSRQFKDNIATTSIVTLDKITQLNVVDFNWNNLSLTPGARDIGLVAEDTYNILPELVGLDSSGNPISVSYSKLSVVALKAAQSLLGVIDITNAPTSTPTIVVSSSGVVAIGTTTSSSAHKLVVGGDVAATGFVNISTQASKKDIDHLDATEENAILDKISSLGVATYHYTQESSSDPLRLGLIAEEAPKEVLSADGKGVDIYKLISFALAGIKAQQARIEDLASRIGETAAARFASLFADEITTRKLCLEDLCVTKEELRSLLNNSSGLTGSTDASTPPPAPSDQVESVVPLDTEPPVISLIGAEELQIPKGSTWIDPGATVSDNVNSNLGIEVTGASIDTSALGDYSVRYNATDGAGNHAVEVIRTVHVVNDLES